MLMYNKKDICIKNSFINFWNCVGQMSQRLRLYKEIWKEVFNLDSLWMRIYFRFLFAWLRKPLQPVLIEVDTSVRELELGAVIRSFLEGAGAGADKRNW